MHLISYLVFQTFSKLISDGSPHASHGDETKAQSPVNNCVLLRWTAAHGGLQSMWKLNAANKWFRQQWQWSVIGNPGGSVRGVALFQKCVSRPSILAASIFQLSIPPRLSFSTSLPLKDVIGIKLVCGAALPRSFPHQRASKHLVSKRRNTKFDVKL